MSQLLWMREFAKDRVLRIEVIKINVPQFRLRNFRWLSELHIFKFCKNPHSLQLDIWLLWNTNRKILFALIHKNRSYVGVMRSMWFFESPVSYYNNWHSIEIIFVIYKQLAFHWYIGYQLLGFWRNCQGCDNLVFCFRAVGLFRCNMLLILSMVWSCILYGTVFVCLQSPYRKNHIIFWILGYCPLSRVLHVTLANPQTFRFEFDLH